MTEEKYYSDSGYQKNTTPASVYDNYYLSNKRELLGFMSVFLGVPAAFIVTSADKLTSKEPPQETPAVNHSSPSLVLKSSRYRISMENFIQNHIKMK
ncbi:hypothetical protein [Tychonema sp. LEGE 07203]|uniref:hypothetical protein n=1 Tax=Tychonema sp. LEGE 07203 TaxID=1828671 RepID=UPI00187DE140|nr:hypothetical protein [Tychonema sp. LEGE 07203]MBE9092704.1 hypothetical protein [Tychonema sp. LEGE 07203]